MRTKEEQDKIDRGIKKDLQDDILKKQRELKDQAKLVKEEARALENEEKKYVGTGDRKEKRWDIVERKGKELTDRNVAGFNPMEINLMELVYAAMEIAKANWYDPINPIKFVTRYLPGMVELEAGLMIAK